MILEHPARSEAPLLATIEEIIRDSGNDRTRLLDVFQAVQQNYGYVSNEVQQAIATGLNMPVVDVEDTLSFYAFLNRTPKGRFQIRLSKTPVSLMKGAADVAQAFCAATGAPLGGTSPDKLFTVEWTSDIGMADREPSALINTTVFNSLKAADVPAIVSALRLEGEPSKLMNSGVRASLNAGWTGDLRTELGQNRRWNSCRSDALAGRGHPGDFQIKVTRPRRSRISHCSQMEILRGWHDNSSLCNRR